MHSCSVIQSCLTLCEPLDYSLPGSSVHGISQARYWSGLSFPTSGDLPNPGIEPNVGVLAGRFFITESFSFTTEFSSVQFSHSVVSDSLRPHESQHARPPCLSPTPRVHSDSRPSSQWCHPAISSSVVPFSSFLFMGFSRQEYWSGLPFSSPVDHILSDLSTMTRPSWVSPRAWLSFIELDKAVVLVWLDWLVFCAYGFSVSALWCPLATPTVLLGFLLPWAWGTST